MVIESMCRRRDKGELKKAGLNRGECECGSECGSSGSTLYSTWRQVGGLGQLDWADWLTASIDVLFQIEYAFDTITTMLTKTIYSSIHFSFGTLRSICTSCLIFFSSLHNPPSCPPSNPPRTPHASAHPLSIHPPTCLTST